MLELRTLFFEDLSVGMTEFQWPQKRALGRTILVTN
jgi:hypothetical protein